MTMTMAMTRTRTRTVTNSLSQGGTRRCRSCEW